MAAVSGPHAPGDPSALLRLLRLEPQGGWDSSGKCPVAELRALAILAATCATRLAMSDSAIPTVQDVERMQECLEEQLGRVDGALAPLYAETQSQGTLRAFLDSPVRSPRELASSCARPPATPEPVQSTSAGENIGGGSADHAGESGAGPGMLPGQLAEYLAPPLLDALVDRFREPVLGSLEDQILDRLVSRVTPELVSTLSQTLQHPLLLALAPHILEKTIIPNKIVPHLEKTLLPRIVNDFYQPVVDALGAKYSWSEERVQRTDAELPGSPEEIAHRRRVSAAGYLKHGGEGSSGFGQKRDAARGTEGRGRKRSHDCM